jgi:signal transduction histidine kinase
MRGEFGDIMVPEDRESAWALLRETFETGKPVRGFVTRQLVNGEPRYISANWEPIRDAEGNVVEVQATSFDITDRVEAERLRARAERFQAVASVASGLAHDINNTLAGMTLWAEVANRHANAKEEKEAIENIQKGAQEGARMLMRIRRFVRPAGMEGAVAVDAADLAAECLDFTRPLWKDHAELHDVYIELKRDLKPVPPVRGNPTELREALVNLIQNAVEAMPEGGTLEVRTYSLAREVCIAVSDTGVGIPSEDQEKIFNPYYTTKGREGSGLGLGVTYGIVSGHGGRIRVRSEVGKGSTFVIHLPVTGREEGETQ